MDLPDPSELWNYRQRLQRHGFSPAEATAVVTATVTGTAHTHDAAELNTRDLDWVDSAANVVSQCGDACSETHTFGAGCGPHIPDGDKEILAGMDEASPPTSCSFETEGLVGGVSVRCEPSSHPPTLTYLFVDRGHGFLSRDEATLLRDTLTAILEEGS